MPDFKMELNEAFGRLTKANPKANYVVMSKDGKVIRTSDSASLDTDAMDLILTKWRTGFKNLTFLKIRTKECEYLVVPDNEYIIVAYLKE